MLLIVRIQLGGGARELLGRTSKEEFMATFLKVLGFIALGVVGLWVGVAVLHTALEITGDLFYWFRRDFLPGLIWAVLIGLGLWGAWVLLFGPERS